VINYFKSALFDNGNKADSGVKFDMTSINRPDIFKYTDYRLFLDEMYRYLKQNNPKFSHRFIAQHAGASSAGWFPNIIRGRINLTSVYLVKLQKLLKLTSTEAEYFELLVAYNQAGSYEEKSLAYDRLQSLKGIEPTLIQKEHLDYLSKWYISAIRELLFIYHFKDNYSELAKMIIPELDVKEAQEALEVLVKIGMVKRDLSGYFRPCNQIVKKDPAVKTELWKHYMKAKARLGHDAIDNFNKEFRDISEVYMTLSPSGFELAREEIAKLRKKLLIISEKDTGADRVYQCTLQLFPLTKSVNSD
jgi:uncharacterized protein (TIGR02147 family)